MEEIRKATLAFYENASEEVKRLAQDFFNSMDADGDGTVDSREFTSILSEKGYPGVNNHSIFQELGCDGYGRLDFDEVLTFYYIIKSRRPFCDGCRILLKGLFFTCVKCHESSNATFDLCSGCYWAKSFSHQHAAFLDNYTLLAHKRLITVRGDQGRPNKRQETSAGSSNRTEGMTRHEKAKVAFVALEAALAIGTTAATAATVCSIL